MDQGRIVSQLFGVDRALVGVVHLDPLPGTPLAASGVDNIVANVITKAVAEARMYAEAGYHGLIIENMGDRPYVARSVGPEVVAAMTAAGRAIVDAVDLAVGVQILAGANQEALAVANAIGAAFIRAEGFVFAHVADEGLLQSDAGELLRYRSAIGAEHIQVFVDIKKKHSAHAITADVDLAETAAAAEFFLADGVIVTGTATGQPTDEAEVKAVAERISIPTMVGSGVDPTNVTHYQHAEALIVGSFVKHDGLWSNDIDPERLHALAEAFTQAQA